MDMSDQAVTWTVVLARFLIPLTIPRFPLPSIVAALVLDAVDQTIFQQFPTLPLADYQGYDKALDIYYLAIAYISTMRNWSNYLAFQVGRFLFYYRLVGVALFEIWHLRALLLIFPNTFEYFFIFYGICRLRWDPSRMTKRLLLGSAALIWIVKLPQEYWIHIAQLDAATDWIKMNIFNATTEALWSDVFRDAFLVFLGGGALLVLVLLAVWRLVTRCLPPADRALTFSHGTHPNAFTSEQLRRARASEAASIIDRALIEKVVMVSLLGITFAQVLPDVRATNLQLAISVAFVITVNTALSHWLARRGNMWAFALREFAVIGIVNLSLVLVYASLAPNVDGAIDLRNTLFFVLLLTLMVTLFDRYRQIYLMRFALAATCE